MRALLLAAGLGTRLRPLTNEVPKCLVPIVGRPLLDYWLELLSDAGVRDVLINLHHLPGPVVRHLANSTFPLNVETVYEEELLGTGGTLLKNERFFAGGPVMVIHADNLSLFDIGAFIRTFEERRKGIDMTMMTFRTDAPQSCGIVEIDAEGTVAGFHEKIASPPGNLANGAVYIVAPPVFEEMRRLDKSVVDFSTEVSPRLLGRINVFENDVYHRDIGTTESLRLAQTEYAAVTAARSQVTRRPGSGGAP